MHMHMGKICGENMLRSTGKRRALIVLEKPEALSCLDTLIPYRGFTIFIPSATYIPQLQLRPVNILTKTSESSSVGESSSAGELGNPEEHSDN